MTGWRTKALEWVGREGGQTVKKSKIKHAFCGGGKQIV